MVRDEEMRDHPKPFLGDVQTCSFQFRHPTLMRHGPQAHNKLRPTAEATDAQPMAKTVFGDEIHFRLKENRLSIVPIKQLLDEIKRDFERMAAGARDGQTEAAVGPIRGFVAKYRMSSAIRFVAPMNSERGPVCRPTTDPPRAARNANRPRAAPRGMSSCAPLRCLRP